MLLLNQIRAMGADADPSDMLESGETIGSLSTRYVIALLEKRKSTQDRRLGRREDDARKQSTEGMSDAASGGSD